MFSRIQTDNGEIRSIPFFTEILIRMWENTDQNNSEYRYFLRSVVKDF